MSGAEFVAVLSIGASVIQVASACSKISRRIQEFRQNIAFQDLAVQLPLLHKDIEALNSPEYRRLLDPPSEQAIIRVLEGCRRQLDALDKLIQAMTPAEDASKLRRAWKGVRSFGKDAKLREIMGILQEYKSTLTLHFSSRRMQTLHLDGPHNTTKTFFEVRAQRVSNFVRRTHVIEQIDNAVNASTINPSIVVLTGAGGQGKTQLALEYCRLSATRYKAIFWINAASEACAIRSFESISTKICEPNQSFPDNQSRIEYVKDRLRTWPERWLLVFDNYDQPHAFKNLTFFFPTSSGTAHNAILVTSRLLCCERLGTCVKTNGLTEEEALELLQSRSPKIQSSHQELEEGKKIVKQLGYLALAIDQAAAYISSRPNISLSLFSEHYEKRKEFILRDTPSSLWEYRVHTDSQDPGPNLSVFTTWELSFEQISENEMERENIGHFLTQAAFFDPRNITESLFKNHLQHCHDNNREPETWMLRFLAGEDWDSFRFQDVVVSLMNLSLIHSIEFTSEEVVFSLHPLVKDWLQFRNSDHVRRNSYVFNAISMTSTLLQSHDVENLNLLVRQGLLGDIDVCVENTRSFLKTEESKISHGGYLEGFQTVFATIYGQHDRHIDAETLFTEALDLQRRILGRLDNATLRTLNNLGALYLDMKKPDKAEDMLKQALYGRVRVLGMDDPLTLNTLNNMGNLYVMLSDFYQASRHLQRTLEGRIRTHGYQHKTVAEAYNNLGEVSMKKGDLGEAERLFKTALEIAQTIIASENTLVLNSMSKIAIIYKLQRRYSEAQQLYTQVINGREALLGPNHSVTLTSMCELGDVYQATGQLDEAERWYVRGKASFQSKHRGLVQLQSPNEGDKTLPEIPYVQSSYRTTQRSGMSSVQYPAEPDEYQPNPTRVKSDGLALQIIEQNAAQELSAPDGAFSENPGTNKSLRSNTSTPDESPRFLAVGPTLRTLPLPQLPQILNDACRGERPLNVDRRRIPASQEYARVDRCGIAQRR
ncbi:MAG: hypothetical protein M1816_000763 [Peltula sp. TS41687]|nr:MAG: hypothetical protein M1816_000763 [Peltula sp. TS41687]